MFFNLLYIKLKAYRSIRHFKEIYQNKKFESLRIY